MYALPDHQHQRLTSASVVTLDGSGEATVTFTRTFATEPAAAITPIGAYGTETPMGVVASWIKTGPLWTGAVVKGVKPTSQALLGVTVLGISVVAGGQTVTPQFTSPASGARFSCIFLQAS